MSNRYESWAKDGGSLIAGLFILIAIFIVIGLFAWWAFSWSTHTLVWFIFIFGSVLGSVKVKTGK